MKIQISRHWEIMLLMLFLLPFTNATACVNDVTANDTLPAKQVFMTIMNSMMVEMAKQSSPVSQDKDFLSQMIPHHNAAIQMARYEITYGKNAEMIQLAKSILTEQHVEVNMMQQWLLSLPITKPGLPQQYQADMNRTMSSMMGAMISQAFSDNIDKAFAQMMIPHHQAAIDMAKVILQYPSDAKITSFAKLLISNEQIEIGQMTAFLK